MPVEHFWVGIQDFAVYMQIGDILSCLSASQHYPLFVNLVINIINIYKYNLKCHSEIM